MAVRLVIVLGLLSVASDADSQSLSASVQKLVAQHIQLAEGPIGWTRAQWMDAAVATNMTCHNLDAEGSTITCFASGSRGLASSTVRFGRKGRIAWYSLDFFSEKNCSAAKGYMISKYGPSQVSRKELERGVKYFVWNHPRKNRALSLQMYPTKTRTTEWGTTEVDQQCHVVYEVGEIVFE